MIVSFTSSFFHYKNAHVGQKTTKVLCSFFHELWVAPLGYRYSLVLARRQAHIHRHLLYWYSFLNLNLFNKSFHFFFHFFVSLFQLPFSINTRIIVFFRTNFFIYIFLHISSLFQKIYYRDCENLSKNTINVTQKLLFFS